MQPLDRDIRSDNDNDYVATFKLRGFLFKNKLKLYRGRKHVYTIKANFFSFKFKVYDAHGRVVGQIGRSFWRSRHQDRYQLRCAAGVDVLLVILGAIAFDQIKQEKKD